MTLTAIDWGKLCAQGRVKAAGIPWNEEELNAVYKLKIPVDYVRKGVLTLEDYEKAKSSLPADPYTQLTEKQLLEKAKEVGIEATPEAPREVLISLITEAEEAKPKQTKTKAKTTKKKTNRKKTKKSK
jgi:hypothetical protein